EHLALLPGPGPGAARPGPRGLAPMTSARLLRTLTLGLALTLGSAAPTAAQPLSSGSGAGTGTGLSGGAARNSTGTGLESGGGASATGSGFQSGLGPGGLPSNSLLLPGAGRYDPFPRGRLPRVLPEASVPLGPGANVTFPGESAMIPLDALRAAEPGVKATDLSRVTDLHLDYARRIPSPGDRSLALSRVASAATFSSQLDLADQALIDASKAALETAPGLVQDQRLRSIISALMDLAEARLRNPGEVAI